MSCVVWWASSTDRDAVPENTRRARQNSAGHPMSDDRRVEREVASRHHVLHTQCETPSPPLLPLPLVPPLPRLSSGVSRVTCMHSPPSPPPSTVPSAEAVYPMPFGYDGEDEAVMHKQNSLV
ncbi:hypothetical protein GWK47_053418 [Chionoecetes opilio]|uniref:Uncharacterized protein n=1 Tax=Chionoecetes opilio TaxID=41210 RepID=A0A8J4XZK0_CHIOP|nr:hypothetical protein GWK47_053418 [Chionoecetes opilio]